MINIPLIPNQNVPIKRKKKINLLTVYLSVRSGWAGLYLLAAYARRVQFKTCYCMQNLTSLVLCYLSSCLLLLTSHMAYPVQLEMSMDKERNYPGGSGGYSSIQHSTCWRI